MSKVNSLCLKTSWARGWLYQFTTEYKIIKFCGFKTTKKQQLKNKLMKWHRFYWSVLLGAPDWWWSEMDFFSFLRLNTSVQYGKWGSTDFILVPFSWERQHDDDDDGIELKIDKSRSKITLSSSVYERRRRASHSAITTAHDIYTTIYKMYS